MSSNNNDARGTDVICASGLNKQNDPDSMLHTEKCPLIIDSLASEAADSINKHDCTKLLKQSPRANLFNDKMTLEMIDSNTSNGICNEKRIENNYEDETIIKRFKECDFVVLNISGTQRSISWKALERLPTSRLGRIRNCITHAELGLLCDSYNLHEAPASPEFHFSRPPIIFETIFSYYLTGKLHGIDNLCVTAFNDELVYWGVDENLMEPCCMSEFLQKKEKEKEKMHGERELIRKYLEKRNFGNGACIETRRMVWDMLEKPSSSFAAKVCLHF